MNCPSGGEDRLNRASRRFVRAIERRAWRSARRFVGSEKAKVPPAPAPAPRGLPASGLARAIGCRSPWKRKERPCSRAQTNSAPGPRPSAHRAEMTCAWVTLNDLVAPALRSATAGSGRPDTARRIARRLRENAAFSRMRAKRSPVARALNIKPPRPRSPNDIV